ncbi:MAG: MetQ/NlpA family ABC transporter substrate-binding protein [Gammaproteobacteria bacterium]
MKKQLKKINFFLLSVIALFALVSCQPKEAANVIKVGTIAGPETELMEVAKDVADSKYHLKIVIVAFTDYTMPNQALYDGQIDANMFQTLPYLQADMKARAYKFVVAGKTFIYPMALYSKKYKSIADIPQKAVIAIPADPVNQERALLLLQKAGLIKIKLDHNNIATPFDISSNPKHLKIKSIDAAQLPRILPDAALAAINTNYAVLANLSPEKNGLIVEDKNSPYVNVIAVRKGDENSTKVKELVDALHSTEVQEAAKKLFHNEVIIAW